jgi:drug/metabolite transporter (DMT)-like permease
LIKILNTEALEVGFSNDENWTGRPFNIQLLYRCHCIWWFQCNYGAFCLVELPPFWGGFIRFLPASLIMFALVGIRRLPLPKGRAMLGAILLGFLQMGASFGLLYWGLQEVQPGMAQVLLALTPLLTLVLAILHRQETFRWRALAGSLLAVAGIALVFSEQILLNVPIFSLLAILLAAVCLAEAAVIIKGFPSTHPITTNAIAMASGSMVFLVMSLLLRETPVFQRARIPGWRRHI